MPCPSSDEQLSTLAHAYRNKMNQLIGAEPRRTPRGQVIDLDREADAPSLFDTHMAR